MNKIFYVKIKKGWKCIYPLFCALIIQITVLFLATVINGFVVIFHETRQWKFNLSILKRHFELSTTYHEITLILAGAICIFIFTRWYRRITIKSKISLNYVLKPKLITLFILLGVSLQFIVFIVLVYLGSLSNSPVTDEISQITIITIIFEVIIAPISDELIFRGVMLDISKKHLPLLAANVLQAIAFGVYHMNLLQAIYAFILGLFMGYVMIWFDTILLPIFLHIIVNLSGNLMFLFPKNIMLSYPFILIFSSIMIIILTTILIKRQSNIFRKRAS